MRVMKQVYAGDGKFRPLDSIRLTDMDGKRVTVSVGDFIFYKQDTEKYDNVKGFNIGGYRDHIITESGDEIMDGDFYLEDEA